MRQPLLANRVRVALEGDPAHPDNMPKGVEYFVFGVRGVPAIRLRFFSTIFYPPDNDVLNHGSIRVASRARSQYFADLSCDYLFIEGPYSSKEGNEARQSHTCNRPSAFPHVKTQEDKLSPPLKHTTKKHMVTTTRANSRLQGTRRNRQVSSGSSASEYFGSDQNRPTTSFAINV